MTIRLILFLINEHLKFLLSNEILKQNTNDTSDEDIVKKSWFTIPFVSEISYKFKDIIKDLNVDLVFFSLNKLNSFIKTHKDSLFNKVKKNVIYKIYCKDCDASYVGQRRF